MSTFSACVDQEIARLLHVVSMIFAVSEERVRGSQQQEMLLHTVVGKYGNLDLKNQTSSTSGT